MSVNWSVSMSYRSSERGAALVVALLVFALAAALMVGLQRDFQLQLQRASNSTVSEQIWAYLLGAEALAATALRLDADADAQVTDPIDDLNEVWAQPAQPYPLDEGGWLSGALEDLQGRISIAELGQSSGQGGGQGEGQGARFSVHQKLMIRLLQSFEEPSLSQPEAIALTEAISDFVDADDQPRPDGAEDSVYRSGDFPYLAANQPLASVSELRAVQGMTPEIYRALAPLVTVWPQENGGLNWRTAPAGVLRALNADDSLEPMPSGEAERLAELRSQGAFESLDAFFEDAFFSGRNTSELRQVMTERSDWFLLSSEVQIADRVRRLYSVIQREGRAINVLYRTDGEL